MTEGTFALLPDGEGRGLGGGSVRDGYVWAMPLEVGIVGLPKSGKTTLFNALTHAGAHVHEVKPHVGMAPIADERLPQLAAVEQSAKLTPASIRVQDVPGTGPALLGNLRQTDALLCVLNGFSPGADPAADLETLKLELLVADRDHVEKRLERARQQAKSGDAKLKQEVTGLEALLAHVEAGGTIADYQGEISDALEPLTTKPMVIVENGPGGIDLQLESELARAPRGGSRCLPRRRVGARGGGRAAQGVARPDHLLHDRPHRGARVDAARRPHRARRRGRDPHRHRARLHPLRGDRAGATSSTPARARRCASAARSGSRGRTTSSRRATS